jgi:hypothetical protein
VGRCGYQREGDRVEVDEGKRFGGGREAESADVIAGVQQQCGFEPSRDQVGKESVTGSFGVDLDVDVGSAFGEPREDMGHVRAGEGFQRAEPQQLPFASDVADGLLGLSEQRSCPSLQPLSGGGQLHSFGAAHEQVHSECSFEGPDLLGDGRGGEVERDGGVGHGPVPDDRFERPELA